MAMTMGSGGGPSSDLNVTPMIDILLVLLVIFMIITPLTPEGEAALIPQPPPPNSKPQLTPQRTIVVQVLKGSGGVPQIKINEESVNFNDLQSTLFNIYKDRAEKVMFVKADDGLAWATVARVIDAAHAAGVSKVGLITAKIEQGG